MNRKTREELCAKLISSEYYNDDGNFKKNISEIYEKELLKAFNINPEKN
jgi:hypothetical protein